MLSKTKHTENQINSGYFAEKKYLSYIFFSTQPNKIKAQKSVKNRGNVNKNEIKLLNKIIYFWY